MVATVEAPARRKVNPETTRKVRAAQTGSTAKSSKSLQLAEAGLTAAVEFMSDKRTVRKSPRSNTNTMTWQHAATGYTRTVPELGAAVMYVGNCHSFIGLKVGKRNRDGTVEDAYNDDGELLEDVDKSLIDDAAEVIATIRSEVGGPAELLRSYGEKMFAVGELYLIPKDTLSGLTFEVLSVRELVRDSGKWIRVGGPGYDDEPLADDVEPLRVHRPDIEFSRMANSSVRSCLEILEELVVLTRLVRSSAISRMALAGILLIADEFDDPEDEEGPDGQNAESTNPLAVDIITTGAKAIDDPASAAAWLPYLLQGPLELIKDGVRFVEFKHDDAISVVKREEALKRLAQGLDLPVEIVLGHMDTTFANASQISDDRFRVHIEPSIRMACDAFTIGILWPALAAKRGLDPETVQQSGYPPEFLTVAVTYDPTKLVKKPDQSQQVIDAYKADMSQTAISNAALRKAVGVSETDKPDDEETQLRIAMIRARALRESVSLTPEQAAQLEETGTIDGSSLPATTAPAAANGKPPAAVTAAALPAANALAQEIIAGAELTLERVAERIGSLCRNKARGAQAATIADAANVDVPRILGPEVVAKLLGDRDPLPTELGALRRMITAWAARREHPEPEVVAVRATSIVDGIAADRIYGSSPGLPSDTYAELVSVS